MKLAKHDLTPQILGEYLSYDPTNGHLTWIDKPSTKTVIGTRAGSLVTTTGYRSIQIFERNYREHQLIWFFHHAVWAKYLDHVNHIRDDNRIVNLREVTKAENSRNLSQRKGTITGEQGIWYCRRRKKWVAEITRDRKKVYQKTFTLIADARLARAAALLEHDFHENHGA